MKFFWAERVTGRRLQSLHCDLGYTGMTYHAVCLILLFTSRLSYFTLHNNKATYLLTYFSLVLTAPTQEGPGRDGQAELT